MFSYYGNHQLIDVAAHRMEDAKNAERRHSDPNLLIIHAVF